MSRSSPRRLAWPAGLALLCGCTPPAPPPPLAPPPPAPPPAAAAAPGAQDAGLALSAALDLARPADAASPPPVVLEAPLAEGGAAPVALLTLPDTVFFDFGRATPRPGSEAAIAALARAVAAAPGGTVLTVAGNTDAIGGAAFNRTLSEARARAVVAALVARGIPPERLDAIGFGAARPVDTNATDAGRARNRRVELALSASPAANREALLAAAPLAAPAPAPAPAAPTAASIRRRPAPLALRKNQPERLRPNPLGPPVAY